MIGIPILASILLATGVYQLLSRRLRHKVVGVALIAQGIPVAIIGLKPDAGLEAVALLFAVFGIGGFLAICGFALSGRAPDQDKAPGSADDWT